jgi:hypothetical protein
MRDWKFSVNEYAVINEKATHFLPCHIGRLVQIFELKTKGINDYTVKLENGDPVFVKEEELNKIDVEVAEIYKDVLQGQYTVKYIPTNETVTVLAFDLLHNQVEISYDDTSMTVVSASMLKRIENEGAIMVEKTGYFEEKGHKLGKLVDEKQAAYGDSISKASKLMKVYLEDYKTDDGYLIPEELLDHILLQVRIIDKQNRIFSNPKADKMNESPYDDISGYGMLGGKLQS